MFESPENKMMDETSKGVKQKDTAEAPILTDYHYPQHSKVIKAGSLDEANEILKKILEKENHE